MKKQLSKQQFGKSHEEWMAFIAENSIRKNTVRKPAFDATKDITEKDLARVQYIVLLDAQVDWEARKIARLEREIRNDASRKRIAKAMALALLFAGFALYIVSAIYTIQLIF